MADNITAPGAGIVLATDDIGGVHYPFTKLAFGPLDTATIVRDADGSRLPVLVGNVVNVAASTLPLPTNAATVTGQTAGNNSLASLDAKFAALESGRAPVAVQNIATLTRLYDFATGQRVTTSGSGQVRSTAVSATEVLLHSSVRGFFRVGDSGVTASVGPGSIPLAADEKFHLRLSSGQFVSFIRDGATDGSLTIMPVA